MNTALIVILGITMYLAVAGWVHFDTTPMIHDDSQLRRTAKLVVLLPVWIALGIVFIIIVIVGEYGEYAWSRLSSKHQTQTF